MPTGRRRRSQGRQSGPDRPPAPAIPNPGDPGFSAALDELQGVLDTPLAELQGTEAQRVAARELAGSAAATPAMASMRELLDVVGSGRPVTQAGYLKRADAIALARRLGAPAAALDQTRRMDDLPEVARLFRWASAAGLLARRGTRIMPGPYAALLERDPLDAWLRVAITLLERGPLDGFRQGWRKVYVELLDAGTPGFLVELAAGDRTVPLSAIEDRGWESVVAEYGYDPDDAPERRWAARYVGALIAELEGLGVLAVADGQVALTGLGGLLATGIAVEFGDELG
ncbi:MAG: hypothetical protein LC720_08470 [Actinobacteria bacterium]|nr:hypothetical protein [Actinomycetota bacterium]